MDKQKDYDLDGDLPESDKKFNHSRGANDSMERISLKRIDEIVDNLGVDHFSRVHKSYLINHLMIEEIKGKAQAQKIKLMNLEILIPVSRTFDLSIFKEDY